MDCKEFSNLLDAFLDGTLPREEADRLETHAAACAECASRLAMLKDCRRLDEEVEAPEGFSSSWRQMIREEADMEKSTPKRRKWTSYLAAAAALVFILGGTALTRGRLPRATRPVAAESGAEERRSAAKANSAYGMMAAGAVSNVTYEDDDMDYAAEEAAEYEDAVTAAEAPMTPMPDADGGAAGGTREEKIIRSASFALKTTAYDRDLEALKALADQVGGRVESLSASGDTASGQARFASLTLRIPTQRLDEFLSGAHQIGSVTDMNEDLQDVSDTYYDIQARLDTQKEKLARLQALMKTAENVSDLVEIESAAADAQYWIDRYTSQLKGYDSRVSYSTVYASLREVKVTEMEDVSLGKRIGEGVKGSLQEGLWFLEDAVVFLAAALPWLLAAGLVTWLLCLAVRKGRKNKKTDHGKE